MSDRISNLATSSEKIKATVDKLKRFDQISVVWIDASQCWNVSVTGRIANHVVETKVVSDGRFLGLQNGEHFSEPHLLILKDCSDHDRGTVQSIPLVLVKQIQVFGKVLLMSEKRSKQGTTFRIRYSDGVLKTVRIIEKNRAD